ncbi:MAG: ABC transporter permease [Candidatus Omnitrophica bacterium]|nr:ABC transporter permease [Candidatus Omnitrophota bacterium]MBU1128221.1 ABC transporter permease [Candidatus Omnitrophota bacterium]MBU1656628.1 ABC transporter permease [Candidatus Omnitrophota bacterium]MBU1784964.1 ABC transporter permease [Candidatus Omnitrophota bacterium]MBU1851807.1 ABC transporter permease [Candidatus Omnitrophota bacterium]
MRNPIALMGAALLGSFRHVSGVLALLRSAVTLSIVGIVKKTPSSRHSISQQLVFAGVQSVVIVCFLAFFTGIVIAMQSARQLQQMGTVIYVAAMVSISMARELGPVFTAIVVAGRVGSAIAAELGTMKVSEQIEALETLAIDPVKFLVVPRFLALLIMLPCLTIFADAMGIVGGFIVGVFNLGLDPYRYIRVSFEFLVWKDVWTGIVKSLCFAAAIGMISCYVGLNTRGGAEGVGKSTTLSVVASFIAIIIIDCILTGIFFFSQM